MMPPRQSSPDPRSIPPPVGRSNPRWWCLQALVVLLTAAGAIRALAQGSDSQPPSETPVHVAYTASIFRDVAESDANAAIKAWSFTLAEENNVSSHSEVQSVAQAEDLVRLLEAGQADLGGMTADDFFSTEARVDLDPLFTVDQGAVSHEQHVVLVQGKSDHQSLTDLRGATFRIHDNARCSVAVPWLELSLTEAHAGTPAEFLGRVDSSTKLSGAVLPVAFGQAQACLVGLRGFQTMSELNPQLDRELLEKWRKATGRPAYAARSTQKTSTLAQEHAP